MTKTTQNKFWCDAEGKVYFMIIFCDVGCSGIPLWHLGYFSSCFLDYLPSCKEKLSVKIRNFFKNSKLTYIDLEFLGDDRPFRCSFPSLDFEPQCEDLNVGGSASAASVLLNLSPNLSLTDFFSFGDGDLDLDLDFLCNFLSRLFGEVSILTVTVGSLLILFGEFDLSLLIIFDANWSNEGSGL